MANQGKEARRQPRRHLIYYLQVQDPVSGEAIGNLVDISPIGMMLISEQAYQPGQSVLLRVVIPEEAGIAAGAIDLRGDCVWCHQDVNPEYNAVGIRFNTISSEAFLVIQELIKSISFQD